MMDMLKKLEEENQQNTDLDSDGEDDGEDLAHRFADIDFGMCASFFFTCVPHKGFVRCYIGC